MFSKTNKKKKLEKSKLVHNGEDNLEKKEHFLFDMYGAFFQKQAGVWVQCKVCKTVVPRKFHQSRFVLYIPQLWLWMIVIKFNSCSISYYLSFYLSFLAIFFSWLKYFMLHSNWILWILCIKIYNCLVYH